MDSDKDNKPFVPENPMENAQRSNALGKYLGLGFSLLALILFPTLLGNWLDRSLEHSIPWITLLFSLLGLCLGFFYVFKELRN